MQPITAASKAPDGPWHTMFFDGSVYPQNPGDIMGLGYRIFGPASYQSEKIAAAPPTAASIAHLAPMVRGSIPMGPGTNNEAEYQALLAGLRHALQLGVRRLVIVGDSQLVIRQVGGEWRCKSKSLRKLYCEAVDLCSCFVRVHLRHVDREDNEACDGLARAASRPGAEAVISDFETARRIREGEPLFTTQQAALLRLFRLQNGLNYSVLGRIFGCTPTVARRVATGKYYKHLTEEALHGPTFE